MDANMLDVSLSSFRIADGDGAVDEDPVGCIETGPVLTSTDGDQYRRIIESSAEDANSPTSDSRFDNKDALFSDSQIGTDVRPQEIPVENTGGTFLSPAKHVAVLNENGGRDDTHELSDEKIDSNILAFEATANSLLSDYSTTQERPGSANDRGLDESQMQTLSRNALSSRLEWQVATSTIFQYDFAESESLHTNIHSSEPSLNSLDRPTELRPSWTATHEGDHSRGPNLHEYIIEEAPRPVIKLATSPTQPFNPSQAPHNDAGTSDSSTWRSESSITGRVLSSGYQDTLDDGQGLPAPPPARASLSSRPSSAASQSATNPNASSSLATPPVIPQTAADKVDVPKKTTATVDVPEKKLTSYLVKTPARRTIAIPKDMVRQSHDASEPDNYPPQRGSEATVSEPPFSVDETIRRLREEFQLCRNEINRKVLISQVTESTCTGL
jgi:hypothetical protein